jgi:hypothetical protein
MLPVVSNDQLSLQKLERSTRSVGVWTKTQ